MGIAETEILLPREGQVLYLARAFDEKRQGVSWLDPLHSGPEFGYGLDKIAVHGVNDVARL